MLNAPKKKKEDDPNFPGYNKLMKDKQLEDMVDMVYKKISYFTGSF